MLFCVCLLFLNAKFIEKGWKYCIRVDNVSKSHVSFLTISFWEPLCTKSKVDHSSILLHIFFLKECEFWKKKMWMLYYFGIKVSSFLWRHLNKSFHIKTKWKKISNIVSRTWVLIVVLKQYLFYKPVVDSIVSTDITCFTHCCWYFVQFVKRNNY